MKGFLQNDIHRFAPVIGAFYLAHNSFIMPFSGFRAIMLAFFGTIAITVNFDLLAAIGREIWPFDESEEIK